MIKNKTIFVIGIIVATMLFLSYGKKEAVYTSSNLQWLEDKCTTLGGGSIYQKSSTYCLVTPPDVVSTCGSGTWVKLKDCGGGWPTEYTCSGKNIVDTDGNVVYYCPDVVEYGGTCVYSIQDGASCVECMTNNDCPSGRICNNKFCIQQSSGCTETDSLKDVFTKGTTTGTPSQDCSSGSCTDSCIGGNLVEYYCGTNGIVYAYTGSETFCANGCLNGACNRNGCQDTSWTPSPITRCVNELLHQTSNCQNTRYIYGTKTCSSGYLCLYGQCYQDTNTINSWVNSPSECVTPKPSACADKRCVTSESDCSSASCPGNCPSGTYSCAYGLCVEYHPSCTSTSQCNDNNACTTDACTSGACYHTSISGCGGTGTNQTIDACNNQCLGFIQSCDSATKTCKMSSFIWIVIGLFGLVIAASAVKKK